MAMSKSLAICGSLAILALLPACGGVSTAEDITTSAVVQKPQRTGPRDEVIVPGPVDSEVGNGLNYTGTGVFTAQAQSSPPGTPTAPGSPQPTKSAASIDGDAVTLNLVAVPIANAAKIVLGDILKLNYTVAEKVAGSITIQTSTPMPRSAVVDVFEQALKLNGAVLVQGNGHYRILPAGEGVVGSASLANAARRDTPGMRLQVVTLRYATASEIKRVVDPITPQGMVAKFDDTRNVLVLAGTATELAEAMDLIGVFDVDWMRGMSVALHPISSSDPEAIVRDLEPMMGIDRDGPLRGSLKVVPSKRLGSIMVITSKPHLVGRARAIIEQLDRVAAATEEQLFVHNVRNRGATELAAILTRVLANRDAGQGTTGGVAPRFDSATLTGDATGAPVLTPTSASAGGIGSGIGGGGIGGAGAIGGIGAGGLAPSPGGAFGASANPGAVTGAPPALDSDPTRGAGSSGGGSRGAKVVADEINHSLLITATRREYERIQRILDRIDVMPTQVMLEAMIAEVTLTDQLKFGVKWHLGQSDNRITLSDAATGAVASAFPGFSYFFAGRAGSMSSVLDALSAVTKVNIVSAPSLMVLDNRRATLQIGDQVPIVTQQAQAVTAGVVGPIINSVALKDTGVILSVTPRVSDNGKVVLEIEQEVSSANRTVTSGIDSPTISQRRVKTSVVVQDGDVVTLGGMIQERNTETKSQVPLLGNLPVVGAAFRQKDDKIERTELLIFIRPLVVANRRDAQAVTQELRQRLNLERPRTTTGKDIFDRDGRRILN